MPPPENISFSAAQAKANPINPAPVSENLSPTSSEAAPANSPSTELPSQAENSSSQQQVNLSDSNAPPPLMPPSENISVSASQAKANPLHPAPANENLPPTSPEAAPATSPETEFPSQAENAPSQEQVNVSGSKAPPQLMPPSENISVSASQTKANPSLSQPIPPLNNSERSPLSENLPPQVSTQPTQKVYRSNQFNPKLNKSPSQPSQEQIKNSSTISPQTLQNQLGENPELPSSNTDSQIKEASSNPSPIKEKTANLFSILASVQQQQLSSSPSIGGVFPPRQDQVKHTVNLANLPQQKDNQTIKPDLSSDLVKYRQLGEKEQGKQRKKEFNYSQSSELDLNYAGEEKNISPQQQLSSASGSNKTAQVKPLADLANTQHFQSSTSHESTEKPRQTIEINIGRIIVRAAEQPPTKTKSSSRRSKPKKPALSLSDYLKQRRTEDKGGR